MGARLLSLLAVLIVVAGCSKNEPESGLITTDSNYSTNQTTTTTADDGSLGGTAGPLAGSQQDFVVNVGDRVFFGYDQYDLTSEARATVERQAQWLKQYPSTSIVVEGHADERGTREYNLALGERRATAVRNYLIANGVDAGRVQVISYGKERPAVMGSDEQSWAQNRRGVVVIQ
jgi:peptidoglycan-associated lipoprotein